MYGEMQGFLKQELASIREQGLYKEERIIMTPQGAEIEVSGGKKVLNFCANNYLGLSSHPKVLEAAHAALERWGYGLSSVRFICGTQQIHKDLERAIADFVGCDDAILYAACFDANGGVFEPFFTKDCAILTDSLNHASVIDGIRLTKAKRYILEHNNLEDYEKKLQEAQDQKFRVIATDGVFSMDGDIAKLDKVVALAEKYNALVMIDDAHSTGFVGQTGRGTAEYRGVMGKVDIITGTFGKAMGGASGGFTAGRQEIVDMLRQRSRPYLFSNTLAPAVAGASLAVVNLISETTELRDKLDNNQKYFRKNMSDAGFDIIPGDHPIVPIMLGKFENDAKLSQDMARELLEEGIYVIGFFFPVVPRGQARIRVQLSAGHEMEHIDKAIEAFTKVGKKYGVVS